MMKHNNILSTREKKILIELAEVLLDKEQPTKEYLRTSFLDNVNYFLSGLPKSLKFIFRMLLHLFDAAIVIFLFCGKFEHFCQLPSKAKRRYVKAWMDNKIGIMKNAFLVFKLFIVGTFYDQKSISRSIGFDPSWQKTTSTKLTK